MAWEWVAPLATLTSGVVGMGFTYKSGTRQLTAQREEEERRQRRTVYAHLASLTREILVGLAFLAAPLGDDPSKIGRLAALHVSLERQGLNPKKEHLTDKEGEEALLLADLNNFRAYAGVEETNPFKVLQPSKLMSMLVEVQLLAPQRVSDACQCAVDSLHTLAVHNQLSNVAPARKSIYEMITLMRKDVGVGGDIKWPSGKEPLAEVP